MNTYKFQRIRSLGSRETDIKSEQYHHGQNLDR